MRFNMWIRRSGLCMGVGFFTRLQPFLLAWQNWHRTPMRMRAWGVGCLAVTTAIRLPLRDLGIFTNSRLGVWLSCRHWETSRRSPGHLKALTMGIDHGLISTMNIQNPAITLLC